jgi:hypothetical protein
MTAGSSDSEARAAVAVPPIDDTARQRAGDQDWDLDLLDVNDPDERGSLIRLAHPELDAAITAGEEEVEVAGTVMNPRLHLVIHEIVATQIMDDDPPEVFETASRLIALGRDPHEVLHMLGSTMTGQIWAAMRGERAYDRADHVAALLALPGTWDREAGTSSAQVGHGRGTARRRRRR